MFIFLVKSDIFLVNASLAMVIVVLIFIVKYAFLVNRLPRHLIITFFSSPLSHLFRNDSSPGYSHYLRFFDVYIHA